MYEIVSTLKVSLLIPTEGQGIFYFQRSCRKTLERCLVNHKLLFRHGIFSSVLDPNVRVVSY